MPTTNECLGYKQHSSSHSITAVQYDSSKWRFALLLIAVFEFKETHEGKFCLSVPSTLNPYQVMHYSPRQHRTVIHLSIMSNVYGPGATSP